MLHALFLALTLLYLTSETQSTWWSHLLTSSLSLSLSLSLALSLSLSLSLHSLFNCCCKTFYFSIIFSATKQSSWLQLIFLCFRFTMLVLLRLNLLYIHTFPNPIPPIRYLLYVHWLIQLLSLHKNLTFNLCIFFFQFLNSILYNLYN